MERIVSTKMPFQYLHMVNFLLFIFVYSAPFVFTTGFKWLSPIPSCIVVGSLAAPSIHHTLVETA